MHRFATGARDRAAPAVLDEERAVFFFRVVNCRATTTTTMTTTTTTTTTTITTTMATTILCGVYKIRARFALSPTTEDALFP